jgi:hypothetical protein
MRSTQIMGAGVALFAVIGTVLFVASAERRSASVRTVNSAETSAPEAIAKIVDMEPDLDIVDPSEVSSPIQEASNNFASMQAELALRAALGSDPFVDPRYETEPIDPEWAPQMTKTIQDLLDTMELEHLQQTPSIECRTSACRVILVFDETFASMDRQSREDIFIPLGRRFSEGIDPVVASSGGRLNARGSILAAPQPRDVGPWRAVFYVQGPRLN